MHLLPADEASKLLKPRLFSLILGSSLATCIQSRHGRASWWYSFPSRPCIWLQSAPCIKEGRKTTWRNKEKKKKINKWNEKTELISLGICPHVFWHICLFTWLFLLTWPTVDTPKDGLYVECVWVSAWCWTVNKILFASGICFKWNSS